MKTTIRLFLAFLCFSVAGPRAQAVSPAPDGGYPGGNTAEGQNALFSLAGGGFNTAVGFLSLRSNTTNGFNTAVGAGTLLANTADENTATGAGALLSNTTGSSNTADGAFALFSNTTGGRNNAVGFEALFHTTGSFNNAVGAFALSSNTVGDSNNAIGDAALESNTSGNGNTAVGDAALLNNTTGSNNIAIGHSAGSALTTGHNNIDIGSPGAGAESNTIRIGVQGTQAFTIIAGINEDFLASGTPVFVSPDGFLGVAISSARFKEEIKPMDKASEAILALKPVTFHYKKGIDPKGIPQFGLVAEEVEKVNRDLVVRDKEGKPYSVRYDQVNAMLLNEFLKEHNAFVEEQHKVDKLQATVADLAAELRQVRAQVQMDHSVARVAVSNR